MSERKPGFWKELKRRGVPKVLAMYAATAFIIMEVVDIMLPRLGLPDWTVTLIIVLLIVGLPVTFVLSWVFDITPHGVVKTGPVEVAEVFLEPETHHRRKLRLSDVLIGILLIMVAVLVYPKVFNKGESHLSRVLRGEVSIAVMPFKNMTGDTLYNLWQEGMQNLLITALSNSEEIAVRQFETMQGILTKKTGTNYASITPSLAGEVARKLEANTVIVGNLHKAGSRIRITANIMNVGNEEIYKSYDLEGSNENDFFYLVDSLSQEVRNFLEIRNIKQQVSMDLGNVYTTSADAYKLYLQGYNCHSRLDYQAAVDFYSKAIKTDSGFVSAMLKLAYCYGDMNYGEMSKYWAYKAFDLIDRLPADMQLMVKAVKATVDKRPLDQINYLKQGLEFQPNSMDLHYTLGWVNFNLEDWEESIKEFEKSFDLFNKYEQVTWAWHYILLGRAYHNEGLHKKETKMFEEGRELWPDQKSTFDYWQAVCAVSRGDSVHSAYYLEEIKKMTEQKGWPEAILQLWYAGVYQWAGSLERAEYYYRKALSLRPGNELIMADLALFLISNDIQLEEGMELITLLAEKYPENATYLYAYGLGLYKKGEYQKASEVLNKSWDLKPYYDHKHFTLNKKIDDLLNRG